jgi:hypothetical protein
MQGNNKIFEMKCKVHLIQVYLIQYVNEDISVIQQVSKLDQFSLYSSLILVKSIVMH